MIGLVGRGLLILVGAGLLYLTIITGHAWLAARQLTESGIVTEGEILDLEPQGMLGLESCVISYSYLVAEQGAGRVTHNATVNADRHFCTTLRVDSKIAVYYLPNDYKTTDVVNNTIVNSTMFALGLADAVFLVGLAIFAIWRARGLKGKG